MLSKSHRTAASIDFEQAMEEDGLFALTIWFAGAQRSYISMCCNLDIAGKVYIESDDQIHGFETTGLEFEIKLDSVLVLKLLDGNFFPATNVTFLEIKFSPDIEDALRKRLQIIIKGSSSDVSAC